MLLQLSLNIRSISRGKLQSYFEQESQINNSNFMSSPGQITNSSEFNFSTSQDKLYNYTSPLCHLLITLLLPQLILLRSLHPHLISTDRLSVVFNQYYSLHSPASIVKSLIQTTCWSVCDEENRLNSYLLDDQRPGRSNDNVNKVEISVANFLDFKLIELRAQLGGERWSRLQVLHQ